MKLSENVPKEDWDEVKLRRVAHINPVKSEVRDLPENIPVSFVEMEDIDVNGGCDLSETRPLDEVYGGYTYFRDNDVLVAKITPCFENGKGGLASDLENGIGFGTTELHVLRSKGHLSPRFLEYITRSHPFRIKGEMEMTGAAGQQRVSEEFIAELEIPVPPEEKQGAIADFLDRKTAAIDELIDKKRRLIELLEEKRDAVINRAVTKGLDPDVPLEDSGLESIGRIPEHWDVWRLKFLLEDIVDCIHSTPTYREDGDYVALRTADLTPGHIDVENALRVNRTAFEERIRRAKPEENDIIYSREGERFGIAALVPEEADVCLAQRVMQLRPDEEVARPDFLMWALNTNAAYHQASQDTVGATSPRVNIQTIANMWLPRPPLEEQRKIAAQIKRYADKKRRVEKHVQHQIDALEKYRQSLITAAVTGQIDVEDYEPETDDPELEAALRN